MKFKLAFVLTMLFFTSGVICAQGNYSYYLQYARKHLDNGDCIRAAINYNMYKEMTNKTDSEIERRIEECSSGKIRSSGEELFGDELQQVDQEILRKVKLFQRYVNNLAGNNFTHTEKEERYEMALDLFINRGEPYEEIKITMEGEYTQPHEAAKMCVITSKRTQAHKYYPMRQYLRNLIRNSENPNYRYQKIVIEGSEVIKIDSYRKVGDGRYMALAHYVQKYTAYQSAEIGRASYMDYTRKTVAVYIDVIAIEQIDGSTENRIRVLLGDVDCEGQAW